MKAGSIIVDLAVEAGGNCTLSKLNQVFVHNNVKIIGYVNFPGRISMDASTLYAKNLVNFISLIVDNDNKCVNINFEDEIIKSVTLTHSGKIVLDQFK